MAGQTTYTVEEAAERLGTTPRTLHYYEEIGLIGDIPRTDGGHRLYDEELLVRLEHILKLKSLLGISLQEIRTVLEAETALDFIRSQYYRDDRSAAEKTMLLEQATDLLQKLTATIDEKIEKLHHLRSGFEQRLERAKQLSLKLQTPE